MPKYKNTKQFVQPVNIEGKRLFIRPDQVFESSKPLDLSYFPFLELVPESTELSHGIKSIPAKAVNPVDSEIQKKLDIINQQIANLVTKKELEENTSFILEKTPQVEPSEVDNAIKNFNTYENRLDTIERRQDVLKSAIDTLNDALKNIENEVYFSNNMVILDEGAK